jgi:hypothetical protein
LRESKNSAAKITKIPRKHQSQKSHAKLREKNTKIGRNSAAETQSLKNMEFPFVEKQNNSSSKKTRPKRSLAGRSGRTYRCLTF